MDPYHIIHIIHISLMMILGFSWMIGGEYDGIGTENLSGNLWETTTAEAGETLLGVIG